MERINCKDAVLRLSIPGDEPQLKKLWSSVFGDTPEYIDTFFEYNYDPGSAMVMEYDGRIISAIYMLPMGGMHFPDGSVLPASITYALATYPEARSHGFGSAVMKSAIKHDFDRGFVCNSLCPAEDSLFPFYTKRIGYLDCFYVREVVVDPETLADASGCATAASSEDYNAFRNSFLSGRLFMAFDNTGINYQKQLCLDTGGDLFIISGKDFEACACCEYADDGTLLIKELLAPENRLPQAATLVHKALKSKKVIIRTPADSGSCFGGSVRRYGQMMIMDNLQSFDPSPFNYYGFGYD